jgi:hypothetical protein
VPRFFGSTGNPSWQATTDMPSALVVALYLRDAAGLDVRCDVAVPRLHPSVIRDDALEPYATDRAAEAWTPWWDRLLERGHEFRGPAQLLPGPPPDLPDLLLDLPEDLRALAETGLPAANAWFAARKREDIEVIRRAGRPRMPNVVEVVREVEQELGHRAAPFDLLISILPVTGMWARRVRRDHVLVSRELSGFDAGFEAFLEPVVRELARV